MMVESAGGPAFRARSKSWQRRCRCSALLSLVLVLSAGSTTDATPPQAADPTAAAAAALAEGTFQKMVQEVEAYGTGAYGNSPCGGYVVTDGVVTLSTNGEVSTPYSLAPKFRGPWGCNSNPANGEQNYETRAPFDTTQVGEMSSSKNDRLGGDIASLNLRAMGVWDFDFQDSTTLEGTVVDQDGRPVDGATGTFENTRTGKSYTTTTDSSGHYSVKVRSGEYALRVETPDCEVRSTDMLICGWGRAVNDDPHVRIPSYEWSVKTSCTVDAVGVFEGSVPFLVTAGEGPLTYVQHFMDDTTIDLRKTESKRGGKFWEGTWEGSAGVVQRVSLKDINAEVDRIGAAGGFAGGWADVTKDSVSPQEYRLTLHLESGPDGHGLAPGSRARFELVADLQIATREQVLGRAVSGSGTVAGQGAAFESAVALVNEDADHIVIRLPDAGPPFGDFVSPYGGMSMKVPVPIAITLEPVRKDR